jgi:hypothetical protein
MASSVADIPIAKSRAPMGFAAHYSLPLRKYWARYFPRGLKLFVRETMSSSKVLGSKGKSGSCCKY